MVGPVVHGPALRTPVFLLGQAPGVREGAAGRPFSWTAGRTLFGWFRQALGVDEATVRAGVYFAAVARCFPGKHPGGGGGDRKPDATEIENCRPWLEAEVGLLRPALVLPVGALAIGQVLGHEGPLTAVVGALHRTRWHGVELEALPLPHPSGVSAWHRVEPGRTLLARALGLLGAHPVMRNAVGLGVTSS